jgi:hypothetical protein
MPGLLSSPSMGGPWLKTLHHVGDTLTIEFSKSHREIDVG